MPRKALTDSAGVVFRAQRMKRTVEIHRFTSAAYIDEEVGN